MGIPSGDIIENVLIPFLGYKEFFHCADNLKINECHEPFFNLLPSSCQLSRFLYQYIPSHDVLCNVLIPFIGYDRFHYVIIDNGVIGTYQGFDCKDHIHAKNIDGSYGINKSIHDRPETKKHGALKLDDRTFWWQEPLRTAQGMDYDTDFPSTSSVDIN